MVDDDGATATVGADGSARSAGGSDGEVGCVHNTATGGHDTAGIVFSSFDGRIGNIDCGAIGIVVIGRGRAAVAKDAVGAGGVGGDVGICDA